MSDALTDIARDQERHKSLGDYFKSLADFIANAGQEQIDAVRKAAARCDSVPRGYWNGKTKLSEKCNQTMNSLMDGDRREWAAALVNSLDFDAHENLKGLSPWPDKKVVLLDYSRLNNNEDSFARIIKGALIRAGKGIRFRGNPSGYFSYAVFYDDDMSLTAIAESAVWVGTEITSCSSKDSGVAYIPPVHSEIDYLESRMKAWGTA